MLRPLHIALRRAEALPQQQEESSAFSLALPIVLFALMYGAFGGEDVVPRHRPPVVDLDQGVHSRALIDTPERDGRDHGPGTDSRRREPGPGSIGDIDGSCNSRQLLRRT